MNTTEITEKPNLPTGDDSPGVFEANQIFLALLVLLLSICFTLGEYVTSKTKYLTEGSFACLLGMMGGLVLLCINLVSGGEEMRVTMAFPAEYFFDVLLPPIIFYQGFSVQKGRLFKNTAVIGLFGIVGTLTSFALISISTSMLQVFTLQTTLRLGALMAATDSVAVLQILNPSVNPLLHSLVFGEGVLNDASSIVLLRSVRRTFAKMEGRNNVISFTVLQIMYSFCWTFTLSLMIGVSIGLLSAVMMKVGRRRGMSPTPRSSYISIFENLTTTHQSALVALLAYLAYILAEALSLSGIMTLFFCGLVMSHYTYHNLEPAAQITTSHLFHALSLLSEIIIYLYVGMDSFYRGNWTNVNKLHVIGLVITLLVSILVSRMIFVFPICYLQNFWNSKKLAISDMFVIVWAGVMRGAVSIALVMYSFAASGAENADRESSTVIAAVMALVLFCIIVLGICTKPVISFFHSWNSTSSFDRVDHTLIDSEGELETPLDTSSPEEKKLLEMVEPFSDGQGLESPRNWIQKRWTRFDSEVMKPIFGGEIADSSDED